MSEPFALRDKAILAGLLDSYWAMEPQILSRLSQVILRHAEGVKLDAAEIAAIVAARADAGQTKTDPWRRGNTAILPITGILVKHSYLVNGESQPRGTATLAARQRLDAAVADETVEGIVMLIDSPGGSVAGIADLAGAIRAADAVKPVVAMIEDVGASAAYWLASQARSVHANATAMVGSIGVYTVMMDDSRWADQKGLRFDLIKAGRHKGIGAIGQQITHEDRTVVQDEIDALYEEFIRCVAAGRGMAPDAVRELADGRVHIGAAAVELGLVDSITTLDELLASIENGWQPNRTSGPPGGPAGRTRAQTTVPATRDQENDNMDKTNTSPPKAEAAVDENAIREQATRQANEAAAQRVRDLTAALGGRTELLTVCISDGLDVTQAKARLADVLAVENKDLAEKLAISDGKLAAQQTEYDNFKALAAKAGIQPLKLAGKADEEAAGGDAAAFEARVAELVAAGAKPHRAQIEAAKKLPDAHAAWLKTQKPK